MAAYIDALYEYDLQNLRPEEGNALFSKLVGREEDLLHELQQMIDRESYRKVQELDNTLNRILDEENRFFYKMGVRTGIRLMQELLGQSEKEAESPLSGENQ